MAEGLLRHRLGEAGVDAEVRSCGLYAHGAPATAHAVAVLAERGIDLGAHSSRPLTAEEVAAADLVVGMERRHVQEAVVLAPEAAAWSFTLGDLVARAEAAEPRQPDESVREWAARLAAGRPHGALLGTGDDEVADPVGGSRQDYERTAALLDDLLTRLLSRVLVAETVPSGTDLATKTGGGGPS